MPSIEDRVGAAIHDYVTTKAAFGIYDPFNSHRPKIPVATFSIEYLEIDDDMTAHVAGPIILQTENGAVEKFLRISTLITPEGEFAGNAEIRAAYIEETNPEIGSCKETAAFANV